MRKFFSILLIPFLVACTGNLVKNPGAETVPLTNEWTIASGKWTQRGKAPSPQEGKAYFFPSVTAHAELFQDIDASGFGLLTDLGLTRMNYSAHMRAFPQRPADKSYQVIEFRNANNIIIDSFKTESYDSTRDWISVTHAQALPNGTRMVRVRLLSDRYNGSNNDGYHDNISLKLSLSWWAYILVLILFSIALWAWKKWNRKHTRDKS